ncbi:unnamed protein product [Spirodela intermedia]|uniref:DYW domain-containing protein n=1 Tax=Spirodela intermedia TaxID=51605 RepID=A0A7I8JFK3_SPIIN|nr:unnamed protein product [Spirodela intermedia]CAA6668919.1 unnamed protein product [Spirodela intermedia]
MRALRSPGGVAAWASSGPGAALAALKALAEAQELSSGKAVHGRLLRARALGLVHGNALIHLYASCGRTYLAHRVFDALSLRNVVSYGALMAGYLHAGLPAAGLDLLRHMDLAPARPNEFIYATALACCSDAGTLRTGEQCHGRVLKAGLGTFPYVGNSLLCMYLACSGVEDAARVLSAASPDVYSCNSMINGYVDQGLFGDAMAVLGLILAEVDQWDHVTFLAALGLCAGLKDLRLGTQIHGQALRRGVEGNIFVGNSVVDMHGKCGEVGAAWRAFCELPDRNVVSWSSIMAAFAQNGLFEEALRLWPEMEEDGVRPNDFSYAIVLAACGGLSVLRHGEALSAHAEKTGFRGHSLVENALINMYARGGSIWDAHKTFAGMRRRDTVSWNSMISGFSQHGLASPTTAVTFVGVLSACDRLGLVDDGFRYLNQMADQMGISPTVEHYTCIVGLLCRAGRLEDAESFMRTTEAEWDAVAWRTLLCACLIHKNHGLGRGSPSRSSTATQTMWEPTSCYPEADAGKGIKKEPGSSWIQVRNQTHVFVSGDREHPRADEIYTKLRDLLAAIRPLGMCRTSTEFSTTFHSEKLAVAFGILTMPPTAPIHVMKNLRICDDCHTALSLISLAAARTVVVRDANRFHCFVDGRCSCGSYW